MITSADKAMPEALLYDAVSTSPWTQRRRAEWVSVAVLPRVTRPRKTPFNGVSTSGSSKPFGSVVLAICKVTRFWPERAASFTSIMAAEGSV